MVCGWCLLSFWILEILGIVWIAIGEGEDSWKSFKGSLGAFKESLGISDEEPERDTCRTWTIHEVSVLETMALLVTFLRIKQNSTYDADLQRI